VEVSIATRARRAGATRLAGIPRRFWLGAASVGLVLAVWVLLAALRWIDPNRVPGPLEVWAAATRLVTRGYANGTLWAHIKESAGLVLVGFVVAVSTGVPVGLLMGCSRRAEAFLNPVLQLIRPVPPPGLDPFGDRLVRVGDRRQSVRHLARRVRAQLGEHAHRRAPGGPGAARRGPGPR
jgi:hypothetical protein